MGPLVPGPIFSSRDNTVMRKIPCSHTSLHFQIKHCASLRIENKHITAMISGGHGKPPEQPMNARTGDTSQYLY